MIDGRNYKAHHRDTNKRNNRWSNFRLATNQQNHANRGKNKNNTSGFKDVVFKGDTPRRRPWMARIMVNGAPVLLGNFATPEEAADAVAIGHRQYFGEFSRT